MSLFALLLLLPAQEIPDRPEKLEYKPLTFKVPDARAMRAELSSGAAIFLLEDPSLPIVEMVVYFRSGSFADPGDKAGVSALTASLMRTGGTKNREPDALDEELDFLAANVGVSMADVYGSATLSVLSKDLDKGLDVLVDVLRNPAFNQKKLDVLKAQALQGLKARNDSTRSIEGREANRLFYGDHPVNRLATGASLGSIERKDLVSFHKKWVYPANFIIAAAGAFKRKEFLSKLDARFEGWKNRLPRKPKVPKTNHKAEPGIYCFHKEGENINQGRVTIGHLGIDIRHPDVQAIRVMSYILGAGGFSSRLMQKVRAQEGLAYSVRSALQPGLAYPSVFSIQFQSKSESCAYAAKLCLDEVARMREEGPTEDELRNTIRFYQDGFPGFFFSTRFQTVGTFARAELLGYPEDYYQTYREKIAALTVKDVRRAARKHLLPDQFSWVVVGNIGVIKEGDGKHPVTLKDLGRIVDVPLADPLTLERP